MKRCSTPWRLALWALALAMPAMALAASPPKAKPTANWAYWRGPSGQGYSDDQQVPLTWGEDKNRLWKTKLPGRGNSSPVVWGDRIFLTASTPNGNERYVLCLRTTDGKTLWKRTASKGVPPGRTYPWNGYASASCATDGQRVYAFFGNPGLFCYDVKGKFLWKHDFGVFTSARGWGTAASPILYKDLVIQNCDNDGPDALPPEVRGKTVKVAPMALVAFDKVTGEKRWTAQRNQGRGFSTPRLITTPKGRLELILNSPHGVWAYNPKDGKEIWHCRRAGERAKFGEPIPVVKGDTLFAPSGRDGPFQAIRLDGKGDVTRTHLRWEVSRKGHRDVASQILWDRLLYAADRSAVLTCFDTRDGKVVFNERLRPGAKVLASPVAVRGKLLFVLDTGETVVLEPGRKLKVVGRNKLGDGSSLNFNASPAIVGGKLFLRSQSHLYCIGEKK
jgi:outer membrane protein assembly factor BamB